MAGLGLPLFVGVDTCSLMTTLRWKPSADVCIMVVRFCTKVAQQMSVHNV